MMKFLFAVVSLLILSSCQNQPTKVNENLTIGPNVDPSMTITGNTVVLDTRTLFSYTSGHLPQAYPIRWQDFSYNQTKQIGLLKNDLSAIARYFVLLGITPESHVVVVGEGTTGDGAEGRIAWMLQYIGVQNVSFATEHTIQLKRLAGGPGMQKNAPLWKPNLRTDLIATKQEVTFVIAKKSKAVLMDVRSPPEYLGQTGLRPPDIGAVNIDWREFIELSGKPVVSIVSRLQSTGITKDQKIIVVSNRGVRSALVTHVLRRLGYARASNYAGGYTELLASNSAKKK